MTNYNSDALTIIKRVCKILSTDTTLDTQLTGCLDQAYDMMNMALAKATTVPLSGTAVTSLVLTIEANIAGGLFKEENSLPVEGERTKKHILRERGEQMLKDFIDTYYSAEEEQADYSEATIERADANMGQFNLDQGRVPDYNDKTDRLDDS